MEYSNLVFLVPQVLLSLSLATAQLQTCSNRGTYSNNSTYSENLNLVLSSLASNITATDGFYNTTAGQDPDKVYALALCRGDLASDKCYNCINSSNQDIIKQCPNKKEALTWGASECMVRYSNHYIFSTMEVEPVTFVPNPNNVTSLDEFNRTLINLMEILVTQASSGSASLKFATGNANFTSSKKIYALVQCTPDLLRNDCRVCLEGAMGDIPDCCGGKEGGRVLRPSCLVWFELFQFYDSSTFDPSVHLPPPTQVHSPALPPPTLFPPNTSTKGNRSTTSRTVIIVVVPAVILVTLIILTCAILRKWKLKQNDNNDDDDMKKLESLQFHFRTIRTATDDFSDANKLGQGGFGSVYKGQLSNSQKIAVKRLSGYSAQGEVEFKNEILLISKLQHRNLVTLLGFCLEGRERLLIYEFMGNGSLDHFIFDPIRCAELNWEQRYKIICGIARGLLYLHEDSRLRIIHRDLKASNILLDEEMNPKISDFGMARLCVMDQTQVNTSKIAGTYGYMAPEYAANGRFSVKSDVFSFGVLILEIVSGKRNDCLCNSESAEHLISYAWKNWREENALNLIDATLGESSRREIIRCIHIGLLCVQENFADRPTMAAVVLTLCSHSSTLPLPSHPAFLLYSATESGLPHPGHTLGISALDQSTNGTDYLSV